MRFRLLFAVFVIGLLARGVRAQSVSDQKLWLEGTGVGELTPRLRFAASASLRSGVDTGGDQLRFDGALAVRINEYLAFVGRYYIMFRDGYAPLGTEDETRHRFAGDINLRVRPQRFELSYRARLQYTTYELDPNHFHVRNRFGVAYAATKRIRPYVALELIYLVSPNNEYRETRFYVGADWRIKKRIELEVYYLRQQETNVRMPEGNNVIGFGLTYTFMRARKGDTESADNDHD